MELVDADVVLAFGGVGDRLYEGSLLGCQCNEGMGVLALKS
jgi:hypothetical protein